MVGYSSRTVTGADSNSAKGDDQAPKEADRVAMEDANEMEEDGETAECTISILMMTTAAERC